MAAIVVANIAVVTIAMATIAVVFGSARMAAAVDRIDHHGGLCSGSCDLGLVGLAVAEQFEKCKNGFLLFSFKWT